MQVIHHGGKYQVTGSCHELKLGKRSILIDCGLFQGSNHPDLKIDFPVEHIESLLVTHSHIDHIGRIPWLFAAGFNGPIYTTPATAALLPLMLEDGLKLQLGLNRQQRERVLNKIGLHITSVPFGQWYNLSFNDGERSADAEVKVRFSPAGHILGSAYIEIELANKQIVVFSGDLGPANTPSLPDPKSPPRADILFLESTYGNKCHESVAQRALRLKAIINRSLADGGAILIPAFSVGRTQELLFDMEQLIHSDEINGNIPVIIDSPLALRVTQSYRNFKNLWSAEAKERLDLRRHPLAFEQCITIDDYKQHMALVNRLKASAEPAIVVAASGMCQGGRIMDYLRALLPDKRTDVILAGFQAKGTLGAQLQANDKYVCIDDQRVAVRGNIHNMSGYSAHADQDDLINFVQGISHKPQQIHLIHGEDSARAALQQRLSAAGYHICD